MAHRPSAQAETADSLRLLGRSGGLAARLERQDVSLVRAVKEQPLLLGEIGQELVTWVGEPVLDPFPVGVAHVPVERLERKVARGVMRSRGSERIGGRIRVRVRRKCERFPEPKPCYAAGGVPFEVDPRTGQRSGLDAVRVLTVAGERPVEPLRCAREPKHEPDVALVDLEPWSAVLPVAAHAVRHAPPPAGAEHSTSVPQRIGD